MLLHNGLQRPSLPLRGRAKLAEQFAISQGLVGYWGFDPDCLDTINNLALDLSLNGNHGTLSGTTKPSLVNARVGTGLNFDGSSSYVTTPDAASLNPTNVSIALWVYKGAASTGYAPLVSKSNTTTDQGYWLNWNTITGTIRFIVKDTLTQGDFNSNTGNAKSVWTHIVATYDGVTQRIYINGVPDGTNSAPNGLSVPTNKTLMFGRDDVPNGYFDGSLDDIFLYNRALAPWEIMTIYKAGTFGKRHAIS